MASRDLESQRLDELCSQEQLDLLNAIDSLRSQGVNHLVSLPQIIVCGDQSSGKSSVLEAISGVSFPVKANTSTRFPTELILRKAEKSSVTVSIIPHHSRSDDDKSALAAFQETLDSFNEVPALIERVKDAMGISTMGKAFSKDLLRIEVTGPNRPHLTIVDLPGLIHSANKHQTAQDVDLITDVVKRYMREPRSVILAVISAKNDYANLIVLSLARRIDPKGIRTLGVVTKPDMLIPGSGSERMYISLARNADVEFRLGWHVLRNRDTDAETLDRSQRDAQEDSFFSSGAWSKLPPTQLGIKSLRVRLSKVLLHQIATELPNLLTEIADRATSCQLRVDQLGFPRATVNEQRLYLVQISQAFQSFVQAATDGTYSSSFFGDAMSDVGYDKRMRAVVQNLNRDFAAALEKRGARYRIADDQEDIASGDDKASEMSTDALSRKAYMTKITTLLDRSRGRELPGLFSPMIVGELFKEQSSPWSEIAENHVRKTWFAARRFLQHLVEHIADPATESAIMHNIVAPQLEAVLKAMREKLDELLEQRRNGHPITYNQYLVDALQDIRKQREKERLDKIFSQVEDEYGSLLRFSNALAGLKSTLMDSTINDMDEFAASEALDYMNAFYKVAKKRFVDDLCVEAIEVCLVAKLKDIFSPIVVTSMDDETIEQIAGESIESRLNRENLKTKLKLLRYGFETCTKFADFNASNGDMAVNSGLEEEKKSEADGAEPLPEGVGVFTDDDGAPEADPAAPPEQAKQLE